MHEQNSSLKMHEHYGVDYINHYMGEMTRLTKRITSVRLATQCDQIFSAVITKILFKFYQIN
jgi:hypothetical protein